MPARLFAAFTFAFLVFCGPASAWDSYIGRDMDVELVNVRPGNVLTVKDGATELAISFYGIGIPTARQPYGNQAHALIRKLLPAGSRLTLTTVNQTDDGIINALVQVADISVNTRLIADGLAWLDRKTCKAFFCRRMQITENTAREKRRGIWGMNMATPPWQWGEADKGDPRNVKGFR